MQLCWSVLGGGGGVQACQGFKVLEQVWVMVRGVAVWLSGRGCSPLQDDDAWLKQAEQVGQGAKMDLRGALGQRWARQKAANKEPGGGISRHESDQDSTH